LNVYCEFFGTKLPKTKKIKTNKKKQAEDEDEKGLRERISFSLFFFSLL